MVFIFLAHVVFFCFKLAIFSRMYKYVLLSRLLICFFTRFLCSTPSILVDCIRTAGIQKFSLIQMANRLEQFL